TSSPALTCLCCTATRRQDFSSSCSAFNRFAHGNRRLPCSTLSGVECHPHTPCAARPDFDFGSYRPATRRNRPEGSLLGTAIPELSPLLVPANTSASFVEVRDVVRRVLVPSS